MKELNFEEKYKKRVNTFLKQMQYMLQDFVQRTIDEMPDTTDKEVKQ